ncbi:MULTISPECIES: cytochrome C [unclassified Beijerinckia]|uniref:c-type cytochrome n=1 Tax=unclassified Beijerinckia TaxID=2638183 RepID=UPI0008954E8A|nr:MULTISPECIES: cytochrome C [unclassified Beijerinckia]MDH7794365.1 sulfide dehydrogenase cytochrome subunit [Beijerinckia sp. GAS462]SEB60051.1 Cytochrome c553 [Beijerinckia sp. 28-YEA-48]
MVRLSQYVKVSLPLALFMGATAVTSIPAAAQSLVPPPGALSCSGCHPIDPSVDSPVTRLDGRDANEITDAVIAFKSGKAPATVMDRIAKGFTDDEIRAIAGWYAKRKE